MKQSLESGAEAHEKAINQVKTMTTLENQKSTQTIDPWRGFKSGLWQREIDLRWFIQQNCTAYEGDEAFLTEPTERRRRILKSLQDLFIEERKKGVLDISQVPSSITAHGPGYIDREGPQSVLNNHHIQKH